MANDYKITITYDLDTAGTESKAAEAGQRDAKAYENAFKGNLDLSNISKAFKPEEAGKKFGASLEESFGKIARDLGQQHADQLARAFPQAARAVPEMPSMPSLPPPIRGAAPEDLIKRIQPVISGMEAFSMLLRGAPLLSIAQMAGQTLVGMGGGGAAAARGGVPVPYARFGRPMGEGEAAERALEPGRADRAIAEYRAGQAAETATGGTSKLAGGLLKGGLVIGAVTEAAKAAYGLASAIGEIGEKGAATATEVQNMADTMGVPVKQFFDLQQRVAATNIDLNDFARSIVRTAVTAKEQMPEIEHSVASSADVMEEANIKVRDSERAVAKSRDDRLLATDRARTAEGELVKVETTGAETREEQRRAAGLDVSGAQIGARGAQMRLAQAGIQAQFASQEQALQDIQGPLTVEGAKLGKRGAEITAEEARERYQRIAFGKEPDPETVRRREIRKALLQVDVAEHNVKQAELRESQAELAEEKRVRTKAAGLGPVGQAQQQLLEAAHGQEQAQLRVQQAITAQKNLEIDQAYTPLAAERNAKLAAANEAQRGIGRAADAQQQAEIDLRKQRYAQEQVQYNDIATAQKALRGEQMPPGFDPRRITPEAFRGAAFREGRYTPGGIMEVLSRYLQGPLGGTGPGADFAEQQRRVVDVLGPQRGRGALPQLTRGLATPEQEQTPEQRASIKAATEAVERPREQIERLRKQEGESAAETARQQLITATSPEALEAHRQKIKQDEQISGFFETSKRLILRFDRFLQSIGIKPPEETPSAAERPAARPELKPMPGLGEPGAEMGIPGAPEEKPLAPAQAKPTELPQGTVQPDEAKPSGAKPSEAKPPTGTKPPVPLSQTTGAVQPGAVPTTAAGAIDALASSAKGAAAALDALKESASGGSGGRAPSVSMIGAPGAQFNTFGGAGAGGAGGGGGGAGAGAGGGTGAGDGAGMQQLVTTVATLGSATTAAGIAAKGRGEGRGDEGGGEGRGTMIDAPGAQFNTFGGAGAGRGRGEGREEKVPAPSPARTTAESPSLPFPWFGKTLRERMEIRRAAFDRAARMQDTQRKGDADVPGYPTYGPTPEQISRRYADLPPAIREAAEEAWRKKHGMAPTPSEPTFAPSGPPAPPPAPGKRSELEDQQRAEMQRRAEEQQAEARRRQAEEADRMQQLVTTVQLPDEGAPNMAAGGLIGGHGSGKSDSNIIRVSRGEYVVTADGSNLSDAIAHFTRGFARGGLVEFANTIAHVPGYASGGAVRQTAIAAPGAVSQHQLDIRTNAGNFTAHVTEDTMTAIRNSSLGGKLSQTGQRPTWYS